MSPVENSYPHVNKFRFPLGLCPKPRRDIQAFFFFFTYYSFWAGQGRVAELERAAVDEAGESGMLKDKQRDIDRVREEWAALRSALRRRVGAARTLLLTDGTCRLHAVPEDRLEQV